MLTIYKDRLIHIEWTIYKGTSSVREDFTRALVKCFLIGPREKYLVNATAQSGTLYIELPQGLEEGTYSIEAIYVKNQGNLTPRREPLSPCNAPDYRRTPYPPFKPHDARYNDRCIMRSRRDCLFAITEYEQEEEGVPTASSGEVTLRFSTSTSSYGYDGLSAYEIAVMRGDFNGSEKEFIEASLKLGIATSERLGGIKAEEKTDNETEEAKIDPVTGKLYVPAGKANVEIATSEKVGGIKAEEKTSDYEEEAKIDPSTGKLYIRIPVASSTKAGGVVAEQKTSRETVEVKIDPKTCKLYVEPIGEGSVTYNFTNYPDDEDLAEETRENEEKVMKLADKEYNADEFSGLGRVYLRKNISASKNVLTQDMVNKSNTRYIVQYDYDLNGETINVKEGCVLDFQGGSLKNGTVVFSNTRLEGFVRLNCRVGGTIENSKINLSWFLTSDYEKIQDAVNCVNNKVINPDDVYGKIYGASFQTIVFEPSKIYTLNGNKITFDNYLKIDGNKAIIAQTDNEDIFSSEKGYNVLVKDIIFLGRDVCSARINNPNLDSTRIIFDSCEFITDNINDTATNYSLYIVARSSQIIIKNCFVKSAPKFLYCNSDFAYIIDCWVNGYSQYSDYARPANTCCIENHSRLIINNSVFIPETDGGVRNKDTRWIDNYSSINIKNSHFGGENGGYSIIWQYKNYFDDTWENCQIIIEDTQCCAGSTYRNWSGIIVLMNNIIPGYIKLRGIRFTSNSPTISLYGYVKDNGIEYENIEKVYEAAIPLFINAVNTYIEKTNNEQNYLVQSKVYLDDSVAPLYKCLSVYNADNKKNIVLNNISPGVYTIGDLYLNKVDTIGSHQKVVRVMVSGQHTQSSNKFVITKDFLISVLFDFGNTPFINVKELSSEIIKSNELIPTQNINLSLNVESKKWFRQEVSINVDLTDEDNLFKYLSLSYCVLSNMIGWGLGKDNPNGNIYLRPLIA